MKKSLKTVLSVILSAAMLLTMLLPAFAATGKAADNKVRFNIEKVENGPDALHAGKTVDTDAGQLVPKGNVRVSIVLDDKATLESGFSAKGIASNKQAMSYRASLQAKQDALAAQISREILGGEKLDVKWNLTLAANIISAEVPAAAVAAIERLAGVEKVVYERQYEPAVVSTGDAEPNMATAGIMTGATGAWTEGYTGAGSKVAIIDTGIDTDHISFDADAFAYALGDDDVDLLTAEEVAAVYSQLNIAKDLPDAAADAYLTAKIPFALNYVDGDLDVTHDNDKQGEHGSHVAGIATANRYVPAGDGYEDAIEAVQTQGVAPDAQLLVMKVFGKGGGAYDSDYFAAIEDAVLLGADAVNLSLGSASAGFATDDTYQEILDDFQTYTDTVVSISAGNAGAWADETAFGVLLGEDNNFDTVGSPGSFANAFTVASVDNDGSTGPYLIADGEILYYTETYDYANKPMVTIAGEHEFVYVDSFGTDEEFAAVADVLEGKIAVCNRGTTSFYEKGNAAVENGAIATIIANNQPGTISMNLTGYLYPAPCVSITQSAGEYLKTIGEAVKDDEGNVLYYTGSLTVSTDAKINYVDEVDYHTMSSFSSFGVPGDLSLKPEITAPGGNIYSVNGLVEGGTAYENMSGTSMAAPHIAGLSAVLAQYVRENGLAEKTGLTVRQLVQSLLMSTAEPMLDSTGYYYPVFQQGAGLADINAAINSKSVIIMDEDTWDYAADGKVKAELGEDADREGEYEVSFTLTNFSDETAEYALSADFFTQWLHTLYGPAVRDISTDFIDASVYWFVNGAMVDPYTTFGVLDFNSDGSFTAADVQYLLEYITGNVDEIDYEEFADWDEDGDIDTYDAFQILDLLNSAKVTAAPGETLEITAYIQLGRYIDYSDLNGNYVEGYLFATETDSEDGALGVQHSIPVLGYYGNYTEASMTDRTDIFDSYYDTDPYGPYVNDAQGFLVRYAGDNNTYLFGGNPVSLDDTYMPERNAISATSGDAIMGSQNTLIRNIAGSRFTITDADGNDLIEPVYGGAKYAAFYYASQSAWQNTATQTSVKYVPTGLADGDVINMSVTFAPEYYQDADGNIDWDALGDGATTTMSAVIDSTAPVLEDAAVTGYDAETFDWDELELIVSDNQYIAGIIVYNDEGEELFFCGSDPDAAPGDQMIVTLNHAEIQEELELDPQTKLLVQVYDYAANVTNYKMNLDLEDMASEISVIADEELVLVVNNTAKLNYIVEPWGVDDAVTFVSSDESIATVDANGIVTGIADGECEITVTSVVDPTASATVYVLVKTISIDLNAVIWDERGQVWLSEFNTATLPAYTKLNEESLNKEIASISYGFDGTLYAASFDMDDWVSDLYTVDPETLEFTMVGSSEIGYMDLAPAYAIGTDYIYAVYGPYIVIVDVASGDYLGVFDMGAYTGGNYLVGISYEEFYPYTDSIVYDFLFLLDEAGTLYEVGINNNFGRTAAYEIGNLGYETDEPFFNSLYFNGESVLWSRFNYGENYVDIIDWDASDTESIFNLGSFEPSVWPVGGLFELEAAEPDETDEPGARGEIAAFNDMLTSVEPIATAGIAAGKLTADDDTADTGVNIPDGAFVQTVDIKASEIATNGLVTVAYDAANFTFAGLKTDAKFSSYAVDEEAGEVTFAYATYAADAYAADTVIATVYFSTEGTADGEYTVTTKEINDEHPDTEETVTETNEHAYDEPEWTWTETETGYDAAATFTCRAHGDSEEATVVTATVEKTVVAPTCTKDGSIIYTATAEIGGKTYTDTKTAPGAGKTGHAWDDGVVSTEPTCAKGGVLLITCANCGATKTQFIAPTGAHVLSAVEAKAPTCTEAGNIACYECGTCGKTFADAEATQVLDDVAIPALGHDFDASIAANVTVVAATCTEAGSKTVKCSRCDETKVTPIAATGHDYQFSAFNWSDDHTSCIVTLVCANDASHTSTADAEVSIVEILPTFTKNGKKICTATYGEKTDVVEITLDTELHTAMNAANDWAADTGMDAFISGSDTNGQDNTAEIAINVDGIWSDANFNGSFDGFMTAIGQAITEYFGDADVTIDGNAVYADGKLQNTAVKNALFDIGAGFFYKIANLGDDGVYGVYNVTVNDEDVVLTVKLVGSDANLAKVKEFAAVISEHISAEVQDGNLVIDVIAPDQLVNTIAAMYQGDETVAEKLKSIEIGTGLNLLPKDASGVFGSQASAVNRLCAFLCKLNPLVNKVLGKITEATVTLADGSEVALLDGAFNPAGESYADLLAAVTAALSDELLAKTVGDFTEKDGVYTIPVNVTVDMANLGIMAGSTIQETVIFNIHLFDNCAHAETVALDAVEPTCTETGLTAGAYCRICGAVVTAQETVPALGHDFDASIEANVTVVPATCTEAGSKTVKCSRCDATDVTAIPAKGHSFEKVEAKDATVTAEGNIAYYKCTVCGKLYADAEGKTELKPADVVIPKLTDIHYGDVDEDGDIDTADARFALRIAVGLDACEKGSDKFLRADVDSNEKIEPADARFILRVAIGLDKPEWAAWFLNQ